VGRNTLLYSLLQESELFCEFVFIFSVSLASSAKFEILGKSEKSWAPGYPWVPQLLLGDWLHNWSLTGEKKIVLCLVCFAYSLLLLVVVVLLLALVFPLLSCWTVFTSTHEFYLFSFLLPMLLRGEGEGWVSSCLVLSCWLPG